MVTESQQKFIDINKSNLKIMCISVINHDLDEIKPILSLKTNPKQFETITKLEHNIIIKHPSQQLPQTIKINI